MNKNILIGLVLLLLVGSGVWYFQKPPHTENQPITNSSMLGLETENTTQITAQSDVVYFEGAKGYFVRPKQEGNYPGVVMIHENRGLRPEIKSTAEQLAKEGYLVLAVDLFNGQVVEAQDQARQLTSSFNQEVGTSNMKSAVAFLKQKGATKIASLGWCFGGRQSVELAISGQSLDATVVYYGGNMATSVEKLTPIKWPVLGIFGDKDQAIPAEMVKTFEASLSTLGIKNEIHIYPGVGHAFANPSGMNYAPNETKDAWTKTLAFLEKNLK